MRDELSWVRREAETWVREGLVESGQAQRIVARYEARAGSAPSKAMLLLTSLGAILAGLAVILFFAYNWEEMHRFAKLAVIFAGIAGMHCAGFYRSHKAGRITPGSQALHLLGTMLFGAGIWLVAQIYHIDEHYPNAFLLWGAAALALAWTLPSSVQGIVACVLLCVWHGAETSDFHEPQHLGPLVLLAGTLPLALRLRSQALAACGAIAWMCALGFTCGAISGRLVLPALFFASCALVAAGVLLRARDFCAECSAALAKTGYLGYLLMLYALSFPQAGDELLAAVELSPASAAYFFTLAAVAALAWIAALWPRRSASGGPSSAPWDLFGFPFALIMVFLRTGALAGETGRWIGAGVFSAVFIFHAVAFILRGSRENHSALAVWGCVLLCLLGGARFFDLFDSLLARASAFLMAGVVLTAVGLYFGRQRALKKAASA